MVYRFSERAVLDTELLYQSSLAQFGPRAADQYFALILAAAQFAADHPLAAPERADTAMPFRVRLFGAHLLVYQVAGDDVIIQRVFHQRQDWSEQI